MTYLTVIGQVDITDIALCGIYLCIKTYLKHTEVVPF